MPKRRAANGPELSRRRPVPATGTNASKAPKAANPWAALGGDDDDSSDETSESSDEE